MITLLNIHQLGAASGGDLTLDALFPGRVAGPAKKYTGTQLAALFLASYLASANVWTGTNRFSEKVEINEPLDPDYWTLPDYQSFLTVGGTLPADAANGSGMILDVEYDPTSTSGFGAGLQFIVNTPASRVGNLGSMDGISGMTGYAGQGTAGTARGGFFGAYSNGAGAITKMVALQADTGRFGSGAVTDAIGLDVTSFYGGGVTNAYGVRVREIGSAANKRAFYSDGAELSSFGGPAQVARTIATPEGGSSTARLIFGSSADFGIYIGSGVPTVSAGQGSLYLRSDGSANNNRAYINTDGGTTWTPLTTAG